MEEIMTLQGYLSNKEVNRVLVVVLIILVPNRVRDEGNKRGKRLRDLHRKSER